MFFFMEGWRKHAEALGLQKMCDDLKRKGYGHEWPMKVYGPEDGATFHSGGGKFHPSPCPFYEGFWWAGGFGAVQCSAAGELLPGAVYERMCRKGHEGCPFWKEVKMDGKDNVSRTDGDGNA